MDIDIDFYNREDALKVLPQAVPASRLDGDELVKHNVGVYLQNIPIDPVTQLAAFPYNHEYASDYFKIDFLNLSIYKGVKNEKHLNELLEREPLWDMLLDWNIVKNLFQINSRWVFDIIQENPPKSIEQLAMLIAVIRPPMKHLRGKSYYEIENEIWDITQEQKEKGAFRKSHAYGYAHALVVQMNLLVEQAMT